MSATIEMYVRKPGPPGADRSVTIRWPEAVRVPVVGEMIALPDGSQEIVREVQWWIDDPEATKAMGRVQVQLIV